jgi:hypothetical protein
LVFVPHLFSSTVLFSFLSSSSSVAAVDVAVATAADVAVATAVEFCAFALRASVGGP